MEPGAPPSPVALRRGLFSIEDVQGPYEGWTYGDHWNGWACPYFEREVALRIAENYRATVPSSAEDGPYLAEYDGERDLFRFFDPGSGEWDEWEAEEVGGFQLYPIGTRSWTWSDVEEDGD